MEKPIMDFDRLSSLRPDELLAEQQSWNGAQWTAWYIHMHGALTSDEFRQEAGKKLREMYIARFGSIDACDESCGECFDK